MDESREDRVRVIGASVYVGVVATPCMSVCVSHDDQKRCILPLWFC